MLIPMMPIDTPSQFGFFKITWSFMSLVKSLPTSPDTSFTLRIPFKSALPTRKYLSHSLFMAFKCVKKSLRVSPSKEQKHIYWDVSISGKVDEIEADRYDVSKRAIAEEEYFTKTDMMEESLAAVLHLSSNQAITKSNLLLPQMRFNVMKGVRLLWQSKANAVKDLMYVLAVKRKYSSPNLLSHSLAPFLCIDRHDRLLERGSHLARHGGLCVPSLCSEKAFQCVNNFIINTWLLHQGLTILEAFKTDVNEEK